jgi:hypothetical protein
MKRLINKEFIISEIEKLIYAIQREREIDKILFDTLGIECDLRDDHPQEILRDSYESLIWNLILIERECPELTSEEFEYFGDLIFDAAWGDNNWNAERIYNYFTNVAEIIADFNLGDIEE